MKRRKPNYNSNNPNNNDMGINNDNKNNNLSMTATSSPSTTTDGRSKHYLIPRGGSSRSKVPHSKHHHGKNNNNNNNNNTESPGARISRFVARARDTTVQKVQVTLRNYYNNNNNSNNNNIIDKDILQQNQQQQQQQAVPAPVEPHSDRWNYALLIVLYTLQGIPMGLSASIPFLLQEKISKLAKLNAAAAAASSAAAASVSQSSASAAAAAAAASYNANAIFALCSWPFSLKLLWAPIVDACYIPRWGRRKTWLVPVQTLAGMLLLGGAKFVQEQFSFETLSSTTTSSTSSTATSMNIQGLTMYFLVLYFLMATQDIAVDGWALTLLQKKNRGKGPVCNSIGQNIGYFLSFVGFLALNDPHASETLWRPLLGLPRNGPNADKGIVSLQGFLTFMGISMLAITWMVAIWKKEDEGNSVTTTTTAQSSSSRPLLLFSGTDDKYDNAKDNSIKQQEENNDNDVNDNNDEDEDEEDAELDASQIGVKETYHRLWAVCQLPAVRWLFLILITYRLPTALSDNVKFLKAVELGMSKSTTALLSPLLILPLGIIVPLVAHKIWHKAPLQQFTIAYIWRVTLVPFLDTLMLKMLQEQQVQGQASAQPSSVATAAGTISAMRYWSTIVSSTAAQAICNSLQFNAQMTFFAHRVDPLIGGSYMTLLNTAANLGGTWPASFVMGLLSILSKRSGSNGGGNMEDDMMNAAAGNNGRRDPYFGLQAIFSILGVLWILTFRKKLQELAVLPDDAWRTHLNENETSQKKEDEKAKTNATATTAKGQDTFTNTTTTAIRGGNDSPPSSSSFPVKFRKNASSAKSHIRHSSSSMVAALESGDADLSEWQQQQQQQQQQQEDSNKDK